MRALRALPWLFGIFYFTPLGHLPSSRVAGIEQAWRASMRRQRISLCNLIPAAASPSYTIGLVSPSPLWLAPMIRPLARLFVLLVFCGHFASAGGIQWRNRVPAGEENPENVGSYTSTIEIGNGGTTGYDEGLDVELDTSEAPSSKFFVTYVGHSATKVEGEFTQELQPGESYTAELSFENNGGGRFTSTQNTVEFLQADGNFYYDLQVETDGFSGFDHFDSGVAAIGELSAWQQEIVPGQDRRDPSWLGKPNGWYYGELTITALYPADGNGDGTVDQADYELWQANYGATASSPAYPTGDYNFDGVTDTADYTIWRDSYGSSVATPSLNAVPEPGACALVALLFVATPLARSARALRSTSRTS